jgi:RNA 3'-terminal phosphate cyclase (ATP)
VTDVLCIDGSYGEGGGQIIRTCLSLAALTGRAVDIHHVRAGRAKPGLQPQHLAAVHAAATLCGAELAGAVVGSQRLHFVPQGPVQPGNYRFDIGTAGAAPLVAQTVLLPLALSHAPSRVTVTGGTHVPHAPSAEYLRSVYLPALAQAGMTVRCVVPRVGFYPRGGGEIELEISPCRALQPLHYNRRGDVLAVQAYVTTGSLPEHVGMRGAAAVEANLPEFARQLHVTIADKPSYGPGAAVLLIATCDGGLGGFSALGARGKRMEIVSEEACQEFREWWKTGAACDEHLADQLVLPLALAAGESRWSMPVISEHLRTVLWVTQQFLPITATLQEGSGGMATITLRGAG